MSGPCYVRFCCGGRINPKTSEVAAYADALTERLLKLSKPKPAKVAA